MNVCADLGDDRRSRSRVFCSELPSPFPILELPRGRKTRCGACQLRLTELRGGRSEEPVEVAEWVALLGRVGDEVSGGAVVQLEGAQEPFGAPTEIRVQVVAVEQSGEAADVPSPDEPWHPPGELAGEALHPNWDRCRRRCFSARGYARW